MTRRYRPAMASESAPPGAPASMNIASRNFPPASIIAMTASAVAAHSLSPTETPPSTRATLPAP